MMELKLNTEFFDIAANQERVFAASDFSIPFEVSHIESVKNTQIRTFKSSLRAAIQRLRPKKGEVLFAQYGEDGEKDRFFDLENVLFYNLGLSAFADCAARGLSFSALSDKAGLCRQNGAQNRKYVYFYRFQPLPAIESHFAALPLMSEWRDVPLNRHEVNSPAKYWKAIRSAREKITVFQDGESPILNCFALKIQLVLPGRIKLANTIKPLLDGVICAFHGENTRMLDCLTDFCVRQHCEELSAPNQFPAILGEREYIRPYRNGQSFLWNPADDLCKLALITVSYSDEMPHKIPLFSGKIYQLL